MISEEYIIPSAEGMHARPAAKLIKITKKFRSAFHLKRGDQIIRMNSMLNILSLCIKGGETVTVTIEGDDEEDAAIAINEFFSEHLKNL